MITFYSPAHGPHQPNKGRVSRSSGVQATGVLVVDEDEVTRTVLGQYLREEGIPVWLASDGEEAIEIYHEWADQIAVVLADANLSGISGSRLYGHLKEWDRNLIGWFMADPGECGPKGSFGATSVRTLAKPPVLTALSDHVRRSLARHDDLANLTEVGPFMKPYLDKMVGEIVRYCLSKLGQAPRNVRDEPQILSLPG